MVKGSVCLLILLIILMVPVSARTESSLQVIETHVNRILDVLRNPGESKVAKKERIWPIIDEIFDYTELSRLSLANYWRAFNPEQRKQFIVLFRQLLGRAYMDRILEYKDEEVVFGKEIKLSEKTVEIQSKIMTRTGSVPIDYRMISEKGQWKVYDVVVEGVSLVSNYRSQFRDILANKTPEILLDILRKKTEVQAS